MTRSFFIIPLFTVFISLGCTEPETGQLEGTWKMESGRYINAAENQTIETTEEDRFSIKVMGPDHFAVVEMFKNKPDSLFFAAVGTYVLRGDKYIEKYDASNVGYQIGSSREFSYTLEEGRWTISSSGEDVELHEVWVKIQ